MRACPRARGRKEGLSGRDANKRPLCCGHKRAIPFLRSIITCCNVLPHTTLTARGAAGDVAERKGLHSLVWTGASPHKSALLSPPRFPYNDLTRIKNGEMGVRNQDKLPNEAVPVKATRAGVCKVRQDALAGYVLNRGVLTLANCISILQAPESRSQACHTKNAHGRDPRT